MPAADMRQMLKFNSKNYLQQDLPDYLFDCYVMQTPNSAPQGTPEGGKALQKSKVLIGGAKKQFVDDLQAAAKIAGLTPVHITLTQVGTANAFELAQSDDSVLPRSDLIDPQIERVEFVLHRETKSTGASGSPPTLRS